MIRFLNVSKRYPGGQDALRGIDFELTGSDMALLVGHSGAGKSTLLKLISVIERPSHGQILIGDRNLRTVKRRDIAPIRRQIGIIFQDHKLLNDRTVFDNVALSLIVAGVSYRESNKRVRAALDKVGLLKKEGMTPVQLSGGEQQRVGIARAVVNRPAILLADEPTGNLDAALSDEIMDLFVEFNRIGTSVLIATHDLRQIERLNKPVLKLDQGKLIKNDLPLKAPNTI
ncbi:MAG: cell division ATP-binding protein FtsE [Arenicellaceae bacterium]|nr:cell division ATP-binding protein FtsE [Arenicellaceae bacterium]